MPVMYKPGGSGKSTSWLTNALDWLRKSVSGSVAMPGGTTSTQARVRYQAQQTRSQNRSSPVAMPGGTTPQQARQAYALHQARAATPPRYGAIGMPGWTTPEQARQAWAQYQQSRPQPAAAPIYDPDIARARNFLSQKQPTPIRSGPANPFDPNYWDPDWQRALMWPLQNWKNQPKPAPLPEAPYGGGYGYGGGGYGGGYTSGYRGYSSGGWGQNIETGRVRYQSQPRFNAPRWLEHVIWRT